LKYAIAHDYTQVSMLYTVNKIKIPAIVFYEIINIGTYRVLLT